jgi:hypothetical protein
VDRGPDLLIVNPAHVVCITQTVARKTQLTLSTGEVHDITDDLGEVMRKLPSPEEEEDD